MYCRPVLAKVKDKNPIVLPGWQPTTVSVVEDTPISQMSQVWTGFLLVFGIYLFCLFLLFGGKLLNLCHGDNSVVSLQAEAPVPVPNIVGFPSPHKAHVGSFLKKTASPEVKNSPLRAAKPTTQASPGPAKKKLALDIQDLSTQVKILAVSHGC